MSNWRQISDFPNYKVSAFGQVSSLNFKRGGLEKILKLTRNPNGYLTVTLRKDNKSYNLTVHRLVALAFINRDEFSILVVNHKDGNKLNNVVENLEWCSIQYNTKHAHDNGLCENVNPKNKNGKIVIDSYTGIFYNSAKELSDIVGVNYSTLRYQLGSKQNVRYFYI